MVQTINMLEALPFPRTLHRVPEYAGGHHEKMDGSGYPRGIYAGDMSVPARMMAIADVFEALTAQDRPYKAAKKLSETMRIMGFMKKDNHLDPELFDLFVTSGVYRDYAKKYLPEKLIDDVDEAALLAMHPKSFTLPESSTRRSRLREFLSEYRAEGADAAKARSRRGVRRREDETPRRVLLDGEPDSASSAPLRRSRRARDRRGRSPAARGWARPAYFGGSPGPASSTQ